MPSTGGSPYFWGLSLVRFKAGVHKIKELFSFSQRVQNPGNACGNLVHANQQVFNDYVKGYFIHFPIPSGIFYIL